MKELKVLNMNLMNIQKDFLLTFKVKIDMVNILFSEMFLPVNGVYPTKCSNKNLKIAQPNLEKSFLENHHHHRLILLL